MPRPLPPHPPRRPPLPRSSVRSVRSRGGVSQTGTVGRTLPGEMVTTPVGPGPFVVSPGHPVRYQCRVLRARCGYRVPPRIKRASPVSRTYATGATTVRYQSHDRPRRLHLLPPPRSVHALAVQQLAPPPTGACACGAAPPVGGVTPVRQGCGYLLLSVWHRLHSVVRPCVGPGGPRAGSGPWCTSRLLACDTSATARNGLAQKLCFTSSSVDNSRGTQVNQIGGVSWKRERSCRWSAPRA